MAPNTDDDQLASVLEELGNLEHLCPSGPHQHDDLSSLDPLPFDGFDGFDGFMDMGFGCVADAQSSAAGFDHSTGGATLEGCFSTVEPPTAEQQSCPEILSVEQQPVANASTVEPQPAAKPADQHHMAPSQHQYDQHFETPPPAYCSSSARHCEPTPRTLTAPPTLHLPSSNCPFSREELWMIVQNLRQE